MKLVIDISNDRYDEIMSMDWKNCRLLFDEEIRAIHDGKALEQEPSSSEKPNKWIPCSERLPRASEIVLLSLPEHTMVDGEECYPCVICGHYIGGNSEEWGISDGTTVGYGLVAYKHCKPVAWMPLPEPYKQEVEK